MNTTREGQRQPFRRREKRSRGEGRGNEGGRGFRVWRSERKGKGQARRGEEGSLWLRLNEGSQTMPEVVSDTTRVLANHSERVRLETEKNPWTVTGLL